MNDPYKEARSIADSLEANGQRECAELLRSSMTDGSTGTEIYMILRWRLANITNDVDVATDVKARIRILHDYLDRELTSKN